MLARVGVWGVCPLVLAGMLRAGAGGEDAGKGRVEVGEDSPGAEADLDLLTGETVSLGGVVYPHFHFQSVYGRTSSGLGHELGAGHHDPVADGWTVQGFEVGLSVRVKEYFEAFAVYHGYWENEDPNDYGDEFEEWFGKIKNLPGGLEFRGGRYLNRLGFHNSTHLHGWDWVDNYLVNGRFLGDDGQYSIGGEMTWSLPVPFTSVLSVSVGEAQGEAHDEAGSEEAHDHEASLFAGEGALWSDVLTTANWTNVWNLNDFHQFRGGCSGAWGDNRWSQTTQVYGAHFQYEWRQHGLEAGGAYFRWRTEAMVRDFDAVSGPLPGEHEHEDEASHDGDHPRHDDHEEEARAAALDDWGFYTSMVYGRPVGACVLEASLRFDWVADLEEAGLAGRRRISPGLTWFSNEQRTFYIRSQYNHDRIDGHGREDSVWIGFGFNWGGPEVR